MSILDASEIDKIAHLAKLIIPENKKKSIQKELNKILDLVAKMKKIDTKTVEPLLHPYDMPQPFREDIVTEPDQHTLLQKVAPQIETGLYIVPTVIKDEE
ncbi:Asp-tRNA(Asn)/Glu-tRNA(Gln) amidotransferase subunit GatC [Coxiella endosymbiont of Amblyomma nuttalli]|uniref:Asp-tRNA(Asn)/Glu-tRNA(Gln) amidotransferase subunit GatC n=1 Tax=Coxiella endosymbiont of Amblyomma nuttalli TaxID=2749996 RepID=UPI001BAE20A7|nr:Asp-tRNA(Asn)/Glu-tRNA(Gln) amidotransferase subunit GatC [Coxiella endosymbiont of Amblyomma nuttalli]QTS83658.1 Glutamyl-tRNA(Gln) amidotransferase subunit C [Coxiella endosymbiont of Amblyomma nuttalli]